MRGYDMDGVLCEGPPPREVPWGRMSGVQRARSQQALLAWYRQATELLRPRGPFVVISARKESPEVRVATERYLREHFGDQWKGLHLLSDGRTMENVVRFKASVIRRLGLTDFTEDNPRVLRGCAKELPEVRLWLYAEGKVVRWPP